MGFLSNSCSGSFLQAPITCRLVISLTNPGPGFCKCSFLLQSNICFLHSFFFHPGGYMSFLHRAYHVPGASPRADSKPQCWVILTRKPRKLTGALCLPAQPLVCLVAYFSLSLFSSFSSHRHKKRTLSMFSPRKWQSTPVLLPGKSHGQRTLVGYSPWGRKESGTTERLHSLGPVSLP